MNLNLITKDKQGEIHVSLLWITLLTIVVGFLFGLGFSIAYAIVDSIYKGDSFYLYYMVKEYKGAILIAVVFYVVYLLKKQEKEYKK